MPERLNKYLSARGAASRRGADQLIAAGLVAVNGLTVTELGTQVGEGDAVTLRGKPVSLPPRVSYLLYKPRGVVCSRARQGKERLVTELVPATPPVYPVGRLDKDSEGLILLTNDGALAQRLTHPSFEHAKTYQIRGRCPVGADPAAIAERLRRGVRLGDGKAVADRASATGGEHGTIDLVITVHEGRHHLIRRMCATVGVTVEQLVRTSVAGLSDRLAPGSWRHLSEPEATALRS